MVGGGKQQGYNYSRGRGTRVNLARDWNQCQYPFQDALYFDFVLLLMRQFSAIFGCACLRVLREKGGGWVGEIMMIIAARLA